VTRGARATVAVRLRTPPALTRPRATGRGRDPEGFLPAECATSSQRCPESVKYTDVDGYLAKKKLYGRVVEIKLAPIHQAAIRCQLPVSCDKGPASAERGLRGANMMARSNRTCRRLRSRLAGGRANASSKGYGFGTSSLKRAIARGVPRNARIRKPRSMVVASTHRSRWPHACGLYVARFQIEISFSGQQAVRPSRLSGRARRTRCSTSLPRFATLNLARRGTEGTDRPAPQISSMAVGNNESQ